MYNEWIESREYKHIQKADRTRKNWWNTKSTKVSVTGDRNRYRMVLMWDGPLKKTFISFQISQGIPLTRNVKNTSPDTPVFEPKVRGLPDCMVPKRMDLMGLEPFDHNHYYLWWALLNSLRRKDFLWFLLSLFRKLLLNHIHTPTWFYGGFAWKTKIPFILYSNPHRRGTRESNKR